MRDLDFEGVGLDSNNYVGRINHIEIPHERSRQRNDALKEAEQTISRSELGKLMRIARPGAIFDASADAQTIYAGEMFNISEEKNISR